MGALTYLVKVPSKRREWLTGALAFTGAGLVASSAVGAALAILGDRLLVGAVDRVVAGVVVLSCVMACGRALFHFRARLPRVRRQTKESWGKRLHPTIAATLWGLDIGSTFLTRFTYSGFSILIGASLISANPAFGAAVFASFWAARSLPVWLGPVFLKPTDSTIDLVNAVEKQQPLLRAVNTMGVLLATTFVVASIGSNLPS